MALLREGDVIEIEAGQTVYTEIPAHFVFSNMKGCWDLTHTAVNIKGELSYLAGRYIVYKVVVDGGSLIGGIDFFPSGHHVYCSRVVEDGRIIKIDFYQTGSFSAMIKDITPVGRAKIKWEEE